MVRRLKIAAAALSGLAVVLIVAWVCLQQAMTEVQPFYAEAIQAEPRELKSASQRMQSRVSALYSDAQEPGRWQTVFTDDEVNGWLAVALEEKYADLLPPEVLDPRVAFNDGRALVGFRYHGDAFDAMMSIEAEAFMADDDVAAVRFRSVRAGALPLPSSNVISYITAAAKKLGVPIRWEQFEGDPVLLVPVADALSTKEERRQLEQITLQEGEILLAGATAPREPPATVVPPVATIGH